MLRFLRAAIYSDLHLEFLRNEREMNGLMDTLVPEREVDLVILAGDISASSQLIKVLGRFCEIFPQVVFVAGNHEFYGSSFPEVRSVLDSIWHSNFHFLDNTFVEISGLRFVGTTLWFPDHPTNIYYSKRLSDFHRIEDFRFHVYEENKRAVDFLAETVRPDDIVVTHHLPSWQSIAERFRGDALNRFFLCSMDKLIAEKKPQIWFHGHTHDSFDYVLDQTRVVCNPLGYPKRDENPYFKKPFLLEIPIE